MTTENRTLEDDVAQAISALTSAARHTYTVRAGEERRHDFGEIVTRVLAAVAANLGGTEQLLAGRPGSWEADGVRQLLRSTLGEDEDRLPEHRTEPIAVWVDVETQLEEQTAGEWDAAWGRLAEQAVGAYDDAYRAALARHAGDPHVVSEADRRRLDGTLSAPGELAADVQAIWSRVREEADWLTSVEPDLAAARRLTDAVSRAQDAGQAEYRGLLVATMQAAAATRGYTVDVIPSNDYDPDNWLANDLAAEAQAATPVPAIPTLDELRATEPAGE